MFKQFSRIIWPTDFWVTIDPLQTEIADKLVDNLETFLGVVVRNVVSFSDEWDRALPVEADGLPLQEFRKEVRHIPTQRSFSD